MKKLSRNAAVRFVALALVLVVVVVAFFAWPAVRFVYRERTLAEAVRKYSATPGVVMTADDDIRQYLVKLAKHHRLNLSEGDVEIDYETSAETFGVPTRIGYTLSAQIDFHGLKRLPLVAQRHFELPRQGSSQSESN